MSDPILSDAEVEQLNLPTIIPIVGVKSETIEWSPQPATTKKQTTTKKLKHKETSLTMGLRGTKALAAGLTVGRDERKRS